KNLITSSGCLTSAPVSVYRGRKLRTTDWAPMALRTAANCGLEDLLRASGFRSLAFSPLLLAFGSGSWAPAVKSISNGIAPERIVYIVAHQDDWQLFMGDAAVESLGTGAPAIFVYLTAGDDGRDSVYWLARERAAL